MTDQLWPTEAREAVADVFRDATYDDHAWVAERTDALLAALADHAVPKQVVLDLADDVGRMTSVHKMLGRWGNYPMAEVAERLDRKLGALAGGDQ